MIINFSVNANSFAYCSVYQGPNEVTSYHNIGNGHYHSSIYLVEGNIQATFSDAASGNDSDVFNMFAVDTLHDLTASKGKYVITKTESTGSAMMMFNPIPDSKKLSVEIIKGFQTLEVSADDVRKTVVCITGPATIKDKTLTSMQYAVVFPNKSATLVLSENSICAIVIG